MKKKISSKTIIQYMVRVAIFGSIAIILYTIPFLSFSLPIFPSFLEFHFDEIPALIAGLAYGPYTAIGILILKTIIKLPFTSTMTVGDISDLFFSLAFILPTAFIYRKYKNLSGLSTGLAVGFLSQLVVAILGNIYVVLPVYLFVLGMSQESILHACQLINPSVTDLQWTYGFYVVLPFNAIKDAIVIAVTILVYLPMRKYFAQIGNLSLSQDVTDSDDSTSTDHIDKK